MAENSSAIPMGRSYPLIKGFKVVTASVGAMQIAAVLIKVDVPIEYYLAGALLVVAVALMLIANFVPPPPGGGSNTLAVLIDQMGVVVAVTSMFFAFSIFLPPIFSIAVLYWGAYLVMIITIFCCFYYGITHSVEGSASGIA